MRKTWQKQVQQTPQKLTRQATTPIAKKAAAPVVKKAVAATPLKPIKDSFTQASVTVNLAERAGVDRRRESAVGGT
jgi:hypothetical protein